MLADSTVLNSPPSAATINNTTIYGLNDRYRGVFGRRDVLFAGEVDLRAAGHGDLVESDRLPSGAPRRLILTAIIYDIARGSVAAYYRSQWPGAARLSGQGKRHTVIQIGAGAHRKAAQAAW